MVLPQSPDPSGGVRSAPKTPSLNTEEGKGKGCERGENGKGRRERGKGRETEEDFIEP